MTKPFSVAKVGAMVVPEALAVTGLIAGHILVRGVDASAGWNRPMRRVSDYMHIGVLGGSAYMVCTDRAPEAMTAVFWADAGIVATILGDLFYERLVAPRIGRVKGKGQGGKGSSALTPAEETKLLLAARERAMTGAGIGVGVGVGASSGIEF